MTEKALRDAAIATIGPTAAPMTLQEVKNFAGKLPDYYNEVTAVDMFGSATRLSTQRGTSGYRITVRSVARIESAALDMRARARAALEYAFLNVGSDKTTPVRFESADPVGEDDGWWSGLMTLTCYLRTRRNP